MAKKKAVPKRTRRTKEEREFVQELLRKNIALKKDEVIKAMKDKGFKINKDDDLTQWVSNQRKAVKQEVEESQPQARISEFEELNLASKVAEKCDGDVEKALALIQELDRFPTNREAALKKYRLFVEKAGSLEKANEVIQAMLNRDGT